MGNLVFQATLGGQVNLVGPNTASTFNLNVPAVSSTIATTSGTETLTNKTLTSPVISGGTIDNAVIGGTTAAAGSFTTLSASSTLSVTGAGTIQGLTVGKGAGAVASNTVVGNGALASGSQSGGGNNAFGQYSLAVNTSGATNNAYGNETLYANTTGAANTAVGHKALWSNTTASNNTAVGYNALYSNTARENTAVGSLALYANTTGEFQVAVGREALNLNTTGTYNTAVGQSSLGANTTGSNNVAVGRAALNANTTASYNTAVGYQALASNTTGFENIAIGYQALGVNTTASYNTAVGRNALVSCTTGGYNTVIGHNSGDTITTGTKNSILGRYNGNQGGLDIRTASNYIVLSDGDGNPAAYRTNNGAWFLGTGGSGATQDGSITLLAPTAQSGYGAYIRGTTNGTYQWDIGSYSWVVGGSTSQNFTVRTGGSGGVYVTSGGTSWTAVSDETQKDIIEPISDAANKVSTLRAVIGKYKTDADGTRRSFLIAQDVQEVLPEAVSEFESDEGSVLGLAYTDVIPLLVAAIKELKATVDAQQVEIDTLKGQA